MRKINPSLYYYKRWIWIQFPWVCISLNNNYSNTPELCRSFETDEFETLEQQTKYTKQALIVAIEAKEKKKQMFNKKNQTVNGFQTSTFNRTTKSNIFVGSGFSSGSRFGEKSAIRSRVINKNSSNIDLNLNTLTKEL